VAAVCGAAAFLAISKATSVASLPLFEIESKEGVRIQKGKTYENDAQTTVLHGWHDAGSMSGSQRLGSSVLYLVGPW
jgi:hypothetical protein